MTDKPIIVIGAGICGVSTAIWLQRSGHAVILMDRDIPELAASYGNAGLLAQWAVAPVNSPTLWRDAPKYLLNPNSPLYMKWGYFPKLLPWLARFMSHATDTATRRIVSNLIPLLTDAVDQHKSLVRSTSLDHWIRDSKFSYAYTSPTAFKADSYSWKLKKMAGFEPTIITGQADQEEEPILGRAIQCLAVLQGHGHVTDPGQYIAELTKHFIDQGGKFIKTEVRDIHTGPAGHVTHIDTDAGQFECSRAVITAGIWSKELMRKLRLKIPMETERGYHVIFENPSQIPRNPMMITQAKFGVNPMDMGLRCAGTVELASHKSAPSPAPVQLIKNSAKNVFPELKYSGTREWMGCRPTLPDSTPMIGEIGDTRIYTGFGHQHVGLTAGPKTGRLITQLIDGDTPNIDMSPYSPGRYLG